MMLIGRQPLGTWILASLGLAREVLDDHERALIEDALAALSASLAGDYDPSQHFPTCLPPAEPIIDNPAARLEAMYRRIWLASMRDLPFVNLALSVEAVGFRRWLAAASDSTEQRVGRTARRRRDALGAGAQQWRRQSW
jgi:hypothetical protein